ncbi:MAG: phosphoheptose isomerase [Chthoniobacteraceae bacterium]|nr:phosphoheptose isomerase [Chthoniobacteraceae bacterium]MDB6174277.1 phosphoheptose isomerase [Chthoniobacteraceae bacterium]
MSIFENATAAAIETLHALRPVQPALEQAAAMVGNCVLGGHKLLVCGNGGSAADGADFATEFACRFIQDRRPYPAINMTGCGSLGTAIGNDYGFEQIFARQVRGFGQPGDLVVALSTSGNSANILAALREARQMGIESIALLGREGGQARGLATLDLIVPGTATARIQEGHKFLLHVLCEIVEQRLQASSPA